MNLLFNTFHGSNEGKGTVKKERDSIVKYRKMLFDEEGF